MNRYLYTKAGAVIGYFDQDGKYLYMRTGLSYFDAQRTYMYTQGGAVYGHVSQDRKYLYTTAGVVIGYSNRLLTDRIKVFWNVPQRVHFGENPGV